MDLTHLKWKETRHRGIALSFLRVDEATGDATVYIRMEPGCSYPAHRHRGPEHVLVLKGAYEDERGRHEAGDYVYYEDGSVHHPRCPDDSETCVLFAIANEGIERVDA